MALPSATKASAKIIRAGQVNSKLRVLTNLGQDVVSPSFECVENTSDFGVRIARNDTSFGSGRGDGLDETKDGYGDEDDVRKEHCCKG